MAAVSVTVAKVAVAIVKDKNLRKTVGWLLVIILSPIILLIIAICMLCSSTTTQANMLVDLAFNKEMVIPENYDDVTEEKIIVMRESFDIFDENETENLDIVKVKSVFYVLYFENTTSAEIARETFVDNFIPISDIEIVYENIETNHGRTVSDKDKTDIDSIYNYIKNGVPLQIPVIGINGFVEPVANWEQDVTSEFGYRAHPITGVWGGHGGIDIGKPLGTPVYASLGGTVTVAQLSSSYGNFVMIDHGNGLQTLYAHNSKLLVNVGQVVRAGEKIAEVGSTGDSTGNHLHFEVRVDGERVNPRLYLS